MASTTKPRLAVIGADGASTCPAPPGDLDEIGMALWRECTSVFEWSDPASYETLFQACCARARAARCGAQITADGELIRTKAGVRDHPLLKHEIAARALCCRLLSRLGLDLEPLRAPGRPPKR